MSDFEKGAARLLPLMAVAYDAEHVGECSAADLSMDCPACDADQALWTAFRSLVFGSPEPRSRSVPTAVEALRNLPAPAQQSESREAALERELRWCEWMPDERGDLRCPKCFGHALHNQPCSLREALAAKGGTP